MYNNKRIAVNTVAIYCRLVLSSGIALFSTRYVLEALGEEDFGLYNVIAGVVALFSFIASTMATTTQRFISFTMGSAPDTGRIREVFGSSLCLHVVVAFVVAAVVLLGGWLLIDNVLSIPQGKHSDALFVLVSVCFGLVGTIVSVSFEALLMAHENIVFVSVCQMFNTLVKLGGALLLLYLEADRLRIYAVIMACLPFLLLLMEGSFCLKRYPESRFGVGELGRPVVFKEIGRFAGWVMIGTTCGTLRAQGVSIILNLFWGVVINAANGIATQVSSTLMFFSTSITTSLRPQLVKSAGEGDWNRMNTLVFAACKYPLLLLTLFGIPLIVAMPFVLSLWLKTVPDYSVVFCRLLVLSALFNQATIGLTIGMEACGKVKLIHTIVGGSFLLVLPVGYFFAHIGFPPQSLIWCIVINEIVASILRIILARRLIDLNVSRFFSDVLLRSGAVVAVLFLISYFIWNSVTPGLPMFLILCLTDFILFIVLTLVLGLNRHERLKVVKGMVNRLKFNKI